jgi:hypothetical protein
MNKIEFNIPNHEPELQEVEALLNKLQTKIKTFKKQEKTFTIEQEEAIVKLSTDLLYMVGELSMPIFALREEMEEAYSKKYVKSPALGKKLYLEQYENVHKPYDKLKNKAFKIINHFEPFEEEETEA